MKIEASTLEQEPVLQCMPVQIIQTGDGAIVKRGRVEVRVTGELSVEAVGLILAAAAAGGTRQKLVEHFAAPHRPSVEALIDHLVARRLLVPLGSAPPEGQLEGNLDIFYWHFGVTAEQVNERVAARRIVVMGVNGISRQFAAALSDAGHRQIEVVRYPLLCNLRLFDERGQLAAGAWPSAAPDPVDYKTWLDALDPANVGCLVATSDFGGTHLMRPWNEFCVKHRWHFLPVVLQDLIGYVGPLIIPGDTACYECVRARQNSNIDDFEVRRAADQESFAGQRVAGFHPSMASMLGDVAAIELSRFYGGWAPPRAAATLIEVSLLGPWMTTHNVLKVPRCRVCGPLNTRPAVSPRKDVFLPGSEWIE